MTTLWFKTWIGLAVLVLPAAWSAPLAEPAVERARALYQQTQYSQALQIIEPLEPKGAAEYELAGLCYYMLEDYKKATESFQKAVDTASGNSNYWDWLGRAYGKRAEHAFPLTAPAYASKARQYFEKAVELDPQNLEALDDLFEYYLQAPGFLGGGQDKAARLSERLRERAPARYHSLQARLAEKQKNLSDTEQHLRQALEAAPGEAGRHIDLARFLARQGRYSESDAAFDHAAQLAPASPNLKFQRARAYIDARRNAELARQLLQDYLKAPLTPDDPPRAEAQELLQKIGKS